MTSRFLLSTLFLFLILSQSICQSDVFYNCERINYKKVRLKPNGYFLVACDLSLSSEKFFYYSIQTEFLKYVRVFVQDEEGFDFLRKNSLLHFLTDYSWNKKKNRFAAYLNSNGDGYVIDPYRNVAFTGWYSEKLTFKPHKGTKKIIFGVFNNHALPSNHQVEINFQFGNHKASSSSKLKLSFSVLGFLLFCLGAFI